MCRKLFLTQRFAHQFVKLTDRHDLCLAELARLGEILVAGD
jgi:hypothetical protein